LPCAAAYFDKVTLVGTTGACGGGLAGYKGTVRPSEGT
jgi:hypothetical protein